MKHILRISTACCSRLLMALTGLALLLPSLSSANPIVQLETDLGVIKLELFADDAPLTVENFLFYVKNGFYNDTFFHRRVENFVLQGGGFAFDPEKGDFLSDGTYRIFQGSPVKNEPGISNIRGTVAMAKLGGDPDSATNQWFFNLADNSANLDSQNGGFTVFGQVIEDGMTLVDTFSAYQTCSDILGSNACFNQSVGLDLGPTPFVGVVDISVQPENLVRINRAILGTDSDGVGDAEESGHPNAGDGNNDSIPDEQQDNVVSFVDVNGNYLTMVIDAGLAFESVVAVDSAFISFTSPPASWAGLNFAHGFYGFNITGVNAGGALTASMILPEGEEPVTFYNYGPTPDDPNNHWYEFLYDGVTGAEINGNVITLHFVDGKRGDSDLDDTNGVITAFDNSNNVMFSSGGPAVAAAVTGAEDTDSGGGCTVSGRKSGPLQAGAWWLLLAGLGLLGMRRAHARTTY